MTKVTVNALNSMTDFDQTPEERLPTDNSRACGLPENCRREDLDAENFPPCRVCPHRTPTPEEREQERVDPAPCLPGKHHEFEGTSFNPGVCMNCGQDGAEVWRKRAAAPTPEEREQERVAPEDCERCNGTGVDMKCSVPPPALTRPPCPECHGTGHRPYATPSPERDEAPETWTLTPSKVKPGQRNAGGLFGPPITEETEVTRLSALTEERERRQRAEKIARDWELNHQEEREDRNDWKARAEAAEAEARTERERSQRAEEERDKAYLGEQSAAERLGTERERRKEAERLRIAGLERIEALELERDTWQQHTLDILNTWGDFAEGLIDKAEVARRFTAIRDRTPTPPAARGGEPVSETHDWECPRCGKKYPHLRTVPYVPTCSACDFKVRLISRNPSSRPKAGSK